MNKFLLPFTGCFCLILPLLISCSAPPPTKTPVTKAPIVTATPSSSAAIHKSTVSSAGSSSSKPSTLKPFASKASSSNPRAAVRKPLATVSSAASSVMAKQHSSASSLTERNPLEAKPVDTGRASISGSVVLLDKDGETISPEGVIINLEPVVPVTPDNQPRLQPVQHRVDMRNKTYLPGLMAVKLNDLVSFVNKDNIKHNTFSSSGENTFDLGTFGPGITQSAKLVAPGIVKVYCNIHPEMATFISVSKHNYSFITQADGKFAISDLPPGRYLLTAWHIRGDVQQSIELTRGALTNHLVTIDTSAFVPTPHKNKFGENYKVKPALFNDEFY